MKNHRIRTAAIACLAGLGTLATTGIGNASGEQAGDPTTNQAAPECAADAVQTTFGEQYFGSHTFWISVRVEAKPGVRCTLPADHPTALQFADAAGAPLPTSPSPVDPESPSDPVTVSPGSPAHFELIMEGYSLEQTIPATLSFGLPGTDQPSTIAWPKDQQYDDAVSYCALRPGPGNVTDYTC